MFVPALLLTAVSGGALGAAVSWFMYRELTRRPRGVVEPFIKGVSFVGFAAIAAAPFLTWPPYRGESPAFLVPYQAGVVAGVLAGLFHRRRHGAPTPEPRSDVDWSDYVLATLLVAGYHWLVTGFAAAFHSGEFGQHLAALPWSSLERLFGTITIRLFLFGVAWATTGRLLIMIGRAFVRDWRFMDGSRWRRPSLLGLGLVPIVLCLVPALAVVPVGGDKAVVTVAAGIFVAYQVANRVAAWWLSERCGDDDADFLTWSVLKTVLRVMATLRAARCVTVTASSSPA